MIDRIASLGLFLISLAAYIPLLFVRLDEKY